LRDAVTDAIAATAFPPDGGRMNRPPVERHRSADGPQDR